MLTGYVCCFIRKWNQGRSKSSYQGPIECLPELIAACDGKENVFASIVDRDLHAAQIKQVIFCMYNVIGWQSIWGEIICHFCRVSSISVEFLQYLYFNLPKNIFDNWQGKYWFIPVLLHMHNFDHYLSPRAKT